MTKYIFVITVFVLFLNSCAKDIDKIDTIVEKDLESQVSEAYKEGIKALEEGDILFAAKKFNDAETLFPQSQWAPKSALMAAYSYYVQDYYGDAIAELDRFIRVYPLNNNLDYAYYLLSISYYEQIVDETKDLQSIIKAKKYFNILINQFPNTEYALDAKFKVDYIDDLLAAKEMYLGRYYSNKKKWIPSINRFRTVIDNYETTIYVEEALYRLVEIHYLLGLQNESQKYAKLLGYNYQSSDWYKKSYGLFYKNYEKETIKKRNKTKAILDKAKSLFE